MKKIPVFYMNEMMVDKVLESPSPRKPKEVVKQWQEKGFPLDIHSFNPVTLAKIKCVHAPDFVDGIMNGEIENGFYTKDKEVAISLPYTSGSFLAAAKEALHNKSVAVSPTSGFHHAEYNKAMGYCTFNGLMIAAKSLLDNGLAQHIGILDCDYHYGNGTHDIINVLDLHENITHITARLNYPYEADNFLTYLKGFLTDFAHEGIDILFYQAGADAHIDDPFGGFLSTEQMRLRDCIVFKFCYENAIPVVWNLAGGYQEEVLPDGTTTIQKVLDLHNNTMQECVKVFVK